MTACGRYPPQPKHKPIEFYGAVRAGDASRLAAIMEADPYFVTQDNGAGAPLHFAVTYKQLEMVRVWVGREECFCFRGRQLLTPLHSFSSTGAPPAQPGG